MKRPKPPPSPVADMDRLVVLTLAATGLVIGTLRYVVLPRAQHTARFVRYHLTR